MTVAAPIKFPQSPLVGNDGRLSREWVQWFLNPQFISITLSGVIGTDSGGTGLGTDPGDGQLLIGNGGGYTLASLTAGVSINITDGPGSVTIDVINIDAALITSGVLAPAHLPAFSGDISTVAASAVATLATVNSSPGAYGSAGAVATFVVNGKGLITVAGSVPIAITNTQVSGLGTLSTQNASAVVITGGAIDNTPIGATTPATIKGTTVTATGAFGSNGKTAQTSAAVNAAIAGSAGATYTAAEEGLINSLLALVNQLRAALVANGIAV